MTDKFEQTIASIAPIHVPPHKVSVKKKRTPRFCVNFRKINAVTVRNIYTIPKIEDTLDSLTGMKLFSVLDLAAEYWQKSFEKQPLLQSKDYLNSKR